VRESAVEERSLDRLSYQALLKLEKRLVGIGWSNIAKLNQEIEVAVPQ
jgi:hypothetical protein